MASARSWRVQPLDGPHRVRVEDIGPLNDVFSDAFTDRYRRDGMVGVRVPLLNPSIWRYAVEDAGPGAMLWRDERGGIAAFNIAHCSGREGWMGPLAVRADHQGGGAGKEIVRAGIAWLKKRGASTIGLETMPRTMDNIGFYSSLGFLPGRLTMTVSLDAAVCDRPAVLLGRQSRTERDQSLSDIAALTSRVQPGFEFVREIELTDRLAIGDTVLIHDGAGLDGFALCHTVPLVEGRAREELRVLKMVLADRDRIGAMMAALRDYARRSGARRVAVRVQGEYVDVYQRLVAMGARLRWTDLRMTLDGYPEPTPPAGLAWSNWEI